MKGSSEAQRGFTLLEMALVVAILGLLANGLVSSYGSLVEQRRWSDTRAAMARIEEALIAYALANGGLPAADSDGDGLADAGQGVGQLPWKSLGLDPQLGRDGWQRPFHYHVDAAYRETLPPTPPDTVSGLEVIDALSGEPLTDANPNAPVALLVSLGANGDRDAYCSGNTDGDTRYRMGKDSYCPPRQGELVAPRLDDDVRWLSRYVLLGKLAMSRVWPR